VALAFASACASSSERDVRSGTTGGSANGSGGDSGAAPTSGGSPGGSPDGSQGGSAGGTSNGVDAIDYECANTATLSSTQTLIADFECLEISDETGLPDFTWLPVNGWDHGGYLFHQEQPDAGTTWSSTPVFEGGWGTPGYQSEGALYYKIEKPAQSWGAGLGIWLGTNVNACVDASAFSGIKFALKASSLSGLVTVTIDTNATIAPPNGTCTLGAECRPYKAIIDSTEAFSQYSLAWSDFAKPDIPGIPALDGQALIGGMNFSANTYDEAETVELWLDNLEFVGGDSELPRDCAAQGD
jgi:hypothetical protein